MSYKLPGPSVNEILNRASQALADSDLLPCFIGSIKQVVRDYELPITLPVDRQYTIQLPGLKPGAKVDLSSVNVTVHNAMLEVVASTPTSLVTVSGRTLSSPTALFTEVKENDYLKLGDSAGTYKIKTVSIDGNSVTLSSIPQIKPGGAFTVIRNIEKIVADSGITLDSDTSISLSDLTYNSLIIISGTPKLSYVAARNDLTGFYDVTSSDNLKADIDVDYENLLGYYLGVLAPMASGGKKVVAYITPDESDESYIEALEMLATRRDIYFIVALSQSQAVQQAVSAHAISMSEPFPSYFRTSFVTVPESLIKFGAIASSSYTQS